MEEINNLQGKPAREIFAALGKEITWPGILVDKHEQMEWLLTKLLSASQTEIADVSVPELLLTLLEDKRYFIKTYRPHCSICDSPVGAICGECGANLFIDDIKVLRCPSGHKLIEEKEYRLVCSEHHRLPTLKPEHCWYLPTLEVAKKLDANIKKIHPGSSSLNSWYIANMQLIVHPERMQAQEIPFEDISCFRIVSGSETVERKSWLVDSKEKCSSIGNDGCSNCISIIKNTCLMRIFNPVIPGYRPQPHRGGEYGDVSGQVLCNGRPLEMKGIIKSNTKSGAKSKSSVEDKINTPLLSTSSAGGEIIRQIVEQGVASQLK